MKTSQLKTLIKEIVNNILKEMQQLRGEWWIDQSGTAMFADGDVGDMNHEAYVINNLVSEFLDYFGIDNDERGTLDQYEEEIKEVLQERGIINNESDEFKYHSDPADFIYDYLYKNKQPIKDEKQLEDAFFIAFGSTNRDAREYALKYWGWKRMKGEIIDTQYLTNKDLDIISKGISDAYSDELEEGEDPEFGINVYSNRTYYSDVPLSIIDGGYADKLGQYRRKYE
jgi:hypothetical protein